MDRLLLLEDVADRRDVFWVPKIHLQEGRPRPLSASDSMELLSMSDQGIQIVEYF
jgi:hypothetical protein